MCCSQLCSHCGWLLLKCSAIGIGFNGAETNCRIAHILGILLMNSCNTDRFLATTVVCSLSTLNLKISKLEIDLIVVGSRFQSLGAAQLNDLSAMVFLVLIFGKVNEAAQSSLRLKLYLDGGKTDIKWRK